MLLNVPDHTNKITTSILITWHFPKPYPPPIYPIVCLPTLVPQFWLVIVGNGTEHLKLPSGPNLGQIRINKTHVETNFYKIANQVEN